MYMNGYTYNTQVYRRLTIDNNNLFELLENRFGVRGSALRWIKSYLGNRSSSVYINNYLSSPTSSVFGGVSRIRPWVHYIHHLYHPTCRHHPISWSVLSILCIWYAIIPLVQPQSTVQSARKYLTFWKMCDRHQNLDVKKDTQDKRWEDWATTYNIAILPNIYIAAKF